MRSHLCSNVLILLLSAVLLLTGGCIKTKPTTCIKPMAETAYVGQVLTFTSCSQNADNYYWDFGDGSHGSAATVTHAYTDTGKYTVTFTPMSSIGSGTPQTLIITVGYPGPPACISGLPDSAYAGHSLTFTSCTQGASSYLWNFGDAGTSTSATATHIYTNPGTYTGALTAFNAGGAGAPRQFTIVVTIDAGSWTFQDTTYRPSDSYWSTNQLFATTLNDPETVSRLNLYFLNSSPIATGTYQVVSAGSLQLPSQVSISVSKDGFYGDQYVSVDGTGQTIQITSTQLSAISRRFNAIGNGITMQLASNTSVTAPLNFNFTTLR